METSTYTQILKTTLLMGGSTAVTLVLGMVRAKAVALMLGPAGVGLLGLFSALVDLARGIAGMGVNSSGVRQIAVAVGAGNSDQVARTAAILKRTALALGCLGATAILLLAPTLSQVTFESLEFTQEMRLLSLAVLFGTISSGQAALVQGLRRIRDLAALSIFSALCGTVITICLVYALQEAGVVPSLVFGSLVMTFIYWLYARRSNIPSVSVSFATLRREASGLVRVGFAFMISSLFSVGGAYVIRLLVTQEDGVTAAGLYQAAWTLGSMYVGFVLQAMGSDFYPRLTAASEDNVLCNRMINEQAEVSLLLAAPGILLTLGFAPVVLSIFYSAEFEGAVKPLRWLCLGMVFRIISWPMGYVLLAKAEQRLFMMTEVMAIILHLGLAWILVPYIGIVGAGVAFCVLYIVHAGVIFAVVRRLTGFSFSPQNRRAQLVAVPLVCGVFTVSHFVSEVWVALLGGGAAVFAAAMFCKAPFARALLRRMVGKLNASVRNRKLKPMPG